MAEKLLLTMEDTMKALTCSREWILHLHRLGHIKGYRMGTGKQAPWRFNAASVQEFAENPPAKVDVVATLRPTG